MQTDIRTNIRCRVARVHLTPWAQTPRRTAEKTRQDQLHRQERNLSQPQSKHYSTTGHTVESVAAFLPTGMSIRQHCLQVTGHGGKVGGEGGVLGDKEERDAFGFIPKMKEDSKSWLLTFVAVLFRDVDKFTDYFKLMLQLNKNDQDPPNVFQEPSASTLRKQRSY